MRQPPCQLPAGENATYSLCAQLHEPLYRQQMRAKAPPLLLAVGLEQKLSQSVDGPTPVADLILRLLGHLRVGPALSFVWLEDRIPSEIRRASGRHDPPRCAPVEEMHLLPRSRRVREQASCEGALVLEAAEHSVQAIVAQGLEEPLDVDAGEPFQSVEAKGGVLNHHGPQDLLCSQQALLSSDLLGIALQLGQINLLIRHPERQLGPRLQNLNDLLQLVGVARDERDCLRHPFGLRTVGNLLGPCQCFPDGKVSGHRTLEERLHLPVVGFPEQAQRSPTRL
eukprot:scaffold69_cov248-Pinguiococcus_pyrenoidosus.AAC.14